MTVLPLPNEASENGKGDAQTCRVIDCRCQGQAVSDLQRLCVCLDAWGSGGIDRIGYQETSGQVSKFSILKEDSSFSYLNR